MNVDTLSPKNLKLSTDRIIIRPMIQQDWPHFNRLHAEPNLLNYICEPLDEAAIQDKFNRSLACWQNTENWHTLMLFEKNSENFIGCFGFRVSSLHAQRAEIGYLALNIMQGKGYIKEAGNAVVNFLLKELNVKKIEAFCSTENTSSIHVLKRLNFNQEGLLRCDHLIGKQWQDSYVFGLVNKVK